MAFSSVRELREYKESLKLNMIQRDIIVGSLLGDGNLRLVGRSKEASFVVDHSIKQKDYVLWKYEMFREWVATKPKTLTRIYHKDPRRSLLSFRFQTLSHSEFTFWYEMFYRKDIKIIPSDIRKILVSPLSLAVWFMDDGNKNHNAVFLNTQQFSRIEQECLIECLYENFGLECTLNKHSTSKGKQLYRVRVDTKSTKMLYELAKEYLLPSMRYKIPFVPVTTLLGRAG